MAKMKGQKRVWSMEGNYGVKLAFGYKDTTFSRWKRAVALAISMLPSNASILLQI